MNVGLALMPQFNVDLVLEEINGRPYIPFKRNPDGVRLWAKHFAPLGSLNRGFNIPVAWSDFFTILLSPTHFDWTKSFLTSKAWQQCVDPSSSETLGFVILTACPVRSPLPCSSVIISEMEEGETSKFLGQEEERNLSLRNH